MELEKEFVRQMRANEERVTSPRLAVFRVLSRKNGLSNSELVSSMQKHGIDRATTYRVMRLFKELGMIREVVAGHKKILELTDSFRGHHHHFWCRNCGKLVDFDDHKIEEELHAMAKRLGITLMSHQIEVSGLCADCRTE